MIQGRRLKNAQMVGILISRDLVKVGVIEPFDEAHRRMMSDGASTIVVRVLAMAASGKSDTEMEGFVKDQVASFIKPAKQQIKRALESA